MHSFVCKARVVRYKRLATGKKVRRTRPRLTNDPHFPFFFYSPFFFIYTHLFPFRPFRFSLVFPTGKFGPGSSVGIATDCGLDGPGSNPSGDEIFRSSRPALGPTQPPVKWVPGLSRGKVRPESAADHSPPSNAAV